MANLPQFRHQPKSMFKIKKSEFFLTYIMILSSSFWISSNWQWPLLWDLEVYEFAVSNYNIGQSPYQTRPDRLDFLYSPISVRFLVLISKTFSLELFFLSLFVTSVFIFIKFLKNTLGKNENFILSYRDWFTISILTFGYSGFGFLAFFSGNVSLIFHLMLQSYLFYFTSVKTKPKIYFYILLVFTSLIKPYFLLYCMVFILWGKVFAVKSTLLVFGISAFFWLANYLLFPIEFQLFLDNLMNSTLKSGDTGLSVFSLLHQFLSLAPSLFFQLLFSIILVSYLNKIIKRENWHANLSALITSSVILNPRLKEYDIASLFLILTMVVGKGAQTYGRFILGFLTVFNFAIALIVSIWISLNFYLDARLAIIANSLVFVTLLLFGISRWSRASKS